MKKGKLTALIAVRRGSQRVKNKNIKPFADSNLLEIKIKMLKSLGIVGEIVVNSDSDKMLKIAENYDVSIQKRDDYYKIKGY